LLDLRHQSRDLRPAPRHPHAEGTARAEIHVLVPVRTAVGDGYPCVAEIREAADVLNDIQPRNHTETHRQIQNRTAETPRPQRIHGEPQVAFWTSATFAL